MPKEPRTWRWDVYAVLLGVVLVTAADAQVPPHKPGDICFTPSFWCWANPKGQAGQPCYCQTQYGKVAGRLN